MSNSKISALSSASTPLTGSEVVPLNQSGTTVKAIVTDFTNAIAITPTNITTTGTNSSSNTIGFQMTGAANQDYRFAIPGVADWRLRGNYASGNFDVVLNGTVLGGFTLGGNFHFSGNATVDTAGKGINFTANTPASGMTSQNLTWYEEGTFTPQLLGGTTNPTVTYQSQSGYYTRIGRLVTCQIYIQISAASGGSGTLLVNLPFTANSANQGSGSCAQYNVTYTGTQLSAVVTSGAANLSFLGQTTNTAWSQLTTANLKAVAVQAFSITVSYFV